jgi:hypothetical protein
VGTRPFQAGLSPCSSTGTELYVRVVLPVVRRRPRHGTPLAPGKPGLSLHLPAPEFSPTPSKPGEPDPRLPALMASPRATLSRCVGPALPEEEGVERFGADAAAMAHALADRGVRLLALDFDLTLVNLHTNGTWMAGWSDLREHLRPLFCALIPAVQRQGIFVSVVTFSGQTDLIRDCLTHAAGTAEHAAAIIVRGEDGSWERGATANGEGRQGFGKQHHVRSCCDEIERLSGHRPAGSEGEQQQHPATSHTDSLRPHHLLCLDGCA